MRKKKQIKQKKNKNMDKKWKVSEKLNNLSEVLRKIKNAGVPVQHESDSKNCMECLEK